MSLDPCWSWSGKIDPVQLKDSGLSRRVDQLFCDRDKGHEGPCYSTRQIGEKSQWAKEPK